MPERKSGWRLASHPDVTLAEARERREVALKILANGADSSQVEAAQKFAEG